MKKFGVYTGPKEFKFVDPDTQYKYQAKTKLDLVSKIVDYRSQNRLPELENLSAVIDDYLCNLPENCGACEDAKLARHWHQYVSGGINLLKSMLFKNYVNQTTANQRSFICKECIGNTFPDKKGFIKWSDEVAEMSIGNRKSTYHDQLGNCSGCSCLMKAKVWLAGDMGLTKEQKDEMKILNPDCWQLTERGPKSTGNKVIDILSGNNP